jgi:glutamate synthase domain-containing protein 1
MCEIAQEAIWRLKQGISYYEKVKKSIKKYKNLSNSIDIPEEDAAFYKEAVQYDFSVSHFMQDKNFENDLEQERYILTLSRKLQEFKNLRAENFVAQ